MNMGRVRLLLVEENDIRRAYARGANCYIVKPVDFNAFRELVAAIDRFWLNVARLPKLERI
jgi:two-component system response regulator